MSKARTENYELIKSSLDLLYPLLKGKRLTHTEVVNHAELILGITMSRFGGKAHPDYAEILSELVALYEREVGIDVCPPNILSKNKTSQYWLYQVKPTIAHSYFSRYKYYLSQDGFGPKAVENIEITCEKILSQCANPKTMAQTDKKRGLVFGDVQSGKTANYLGLINMAYDYGYRIVILLAGSTNSLRLQTQKRTDKGVIGAKSDSIGNVVEYIGVGFENQEYYAIPFTNQANDFKKFIQRNLNAGIGDFNKPVVLVVKKVKSILESVAERLQAALNEKGLDSKSIFIIDDEADYASINTASDEKNPSAINRCIRKIFNKFPIVSYVGYTATPFANIFINPYDEDESNYDLFPSDFVVQLNAPSNYFGGRTIFPASDVASKYLRILDESEPNFLPVIHDKYEDFDELPDSLKEAIHCFLINNVIRTLRNQPTKHRSMMINITRFNNVQEQIRDVVSEYVEKLQNAIEQLFLRSTEKFIQNNDLRAMYDLFNSKVYEEIRMGTSEEQCDPVTWEQIQHGLYSEITKVITVVINSRNGKMSSRDENGLSKRFDYEDYNDTGARVIAIGGMVLSRGLTLEGLMTSYYSRNAGAYDTLLQMCRWFGYRPKYMDLCRIYLTQENIDRFDAVLQAVEDLRLQFQEMELQDKKPQDFGLMVRESPEKLNTSLLVTARTKMRETETIEYYLNYGGVYADTSKLSTEPLINKHNLSVWDELYQKLTFSVIHKRYIAQHASKYDIAEFIRKLKIPYVNSKFDTEGLAEYIENSDIFPYWDVVVAIGDSDKPFISSLKQTSRSFHIKSCDDKYIRIGGNNNRVLDPGILNAGLWLTDDKKKLILEDKNTRLGRKYRELTATDYLARRECPILVIYPIDLKVDRYSEDETEIRKVQIKDSLGDGVPLLAFAIGFPKKESKVMVKYRANRRKLDELNVGIELNDEDEGVDDTDD